MSADPLGWFDALYREAHGDPSAIPWADRADNPLFVAWRERTEIPPSAGSWPSIVGWGRTPLPG